MRVREYANKTTMECLSGELDSQLESAIATTTHTGGLSDGNGIVARSVVSLRFEIAHFVLLSQ